MSRPSEVYVRTLTGEEQQWVQCLYHHTTDAMLKTGCHVLLLLVQRYSVPQIATLLFYSEDIVADTIRQFNRSGLQGIIPLPKGGRQALLTEEFLKKLLELVESDPRDPGYGFSSWTAGLLAAVLAEQTGVEVSESCVRRAPAEEIDLYYEDEVDLARFSGVLCWWSIQGHQRNIETPRQNKNQYGAGVILWVSGKLYWAVSNHKDNALFRSVLTQVVLEAHASDEAPTCKKYVVMDNYRIHFAQPVQAWLAEHADQVELVCLPTYSPQLNPVERECPQVRRRVTHNHLFQPVERLMEAVQVFFRDMAAHPDLNRQVAGLAA